MPFSCLNTLIPSKRICLLRNYIELLISFTESNILIKECNTNSCLTFYDSISNLKRLSRAATCFPLTYCFWWKATYCTPVSMAGASNKIFRENFLKLKHMHGVRQAPRDRSYWIWLSLTKNISKSLNTPVFYFIFLFYWQIWTVKPLYWKHNLRTRYS